MKAEKDKNTGKWLIQFRYTNWQGERKKTTKRGFNTKREAEEWVRNFLMSQQADFNMNFEEFVKIYRADVENRIRPNTGETKDNIIDKKILPYFGKKSVNSITAADIRNWQNIMMSLRKKNGKPYSETYLHTINNQLSAIFNYAVKFYDLANNPCRKAGSMGRKQADEMRFLTVDEFSRFIDGVMDKQKSYVTFMTLFWTGMRLGEMLALTPADIDFEKSLYDGITGETAGIFLMAGDTGAGKSVILDGISMALYKKTPRITGVSNSKNNKYNNEEGESIQINSIQQYVRFFGSIINAMQLNID